MFHHPLPTTHPDLLSLQNSQTLRFQRLVQQRKRMQHLTLLIQQQKQTIEILQAQNSSINQQFYQLKLQNQLLNDKLSVSTHHCQDLTEVLIKQISLVQTLRGCYFGSILMNDFEKNILDQEIQSSLGLYHAIQSGKANLHISNFNSQMTNLAEQNQLLNQKYQTLCADYLQLNKTLKVKEYELLKLQKHKHSGTARHTHHQHASTQLDCDDQDQRYTVHKDEKKTSKSKSRPKATQNELENKLQIKELQIADFKKLIQKLQEDIRKRDELIKEHRKNQKQQKKLVDYLKVKFNEEGKQLSQLAKSKTVIEIEPAKTEVVYEMVEKPSVKNSVVKKVLHVVPSVNQSVETKVFEERSINSNSSKLQNSSSGCQLKVMSKGECDKSRDSGLKKTLSKCLIEN